MGYTLTGLRGRVLNPRRTLTPHVSLTRSLPPSLPPGDFDLVRGELERRLDLLQDEAQREREAVEALKLEGLFLCTSPSLPL